MVVTLSVPVLLSVPKLQLRNSRPISPAADLRKGGYFVPKLWIGANGKATEFSNTASLELVSPDSWQNLSEATREALVCA